MLITRLSWLYEHDTRLLDCAGGYRHSTSTQTCLVGAILYPDEWRTRNVGAVCGLVVFLKQHTDMQDAMSGTLLGTIPMSRELHISTFSFVQTVFYSCWQEPPVGMNPGPGGGM